MDDKVRRGLGLLAIAGLGLVLFLIGRAISTEPGDGAEQVAQGGLLLLLVALVVGLINIASGLLRPSDKS